ncbi:MAG: hypothetical protein AAF637_02225 [Pseudomonadota bacterium]
MPCRLAVFLSRQAPVGVVLRRGPSAWTQLIHWDRANDHFTPGQWFRGRMYERRCDLSPDGRLFIYFAGKFGPRPQGTEGVGETWTAISRPPYFTALALCPNLGAWYGGGVFRNDRTVLMDNTGSPDAHPKFRPHGLKIERVPPTSAPWEQRLLRDRWQLVERGFDPRTHRRVGVREIWQKPRLDGAITLSRQIEDVDFRRYGSPYAETYWLETPEDLIPIEGATWVEWDRWDRLVMAKDGKLFAGLVDGAVLTTTELYDFNGLQPQEIPTPDWAQRW